MKPHAVIEPIAKHRVPNTYTPYMPHNRKIIHPEELYQGFKAHKFFAVIHIINFNTYWLDLVSSSLFFFSLILCRTANIKNLTFLWLDLKFEQKLLNVSNGEPHTSAISTHMWIYLQITHRFFCLYQSRAPSFLSLKIHSLGSISLCIVLAPLTLSVCATRLCKYVWEFHRF